MSSIWIDAISPVWLLFVGPSAVVYDIIFEVGHYAQILNLFFFHMCHIFRNHRLLQLYATSSDLDLGLGSRDQCKAEPVDFILLHKFQLIKKKCVMVIKQFQLNILILLLTGIWRIKNNCCLTHCLKTFNFGMH